MSRVMKRFMSELLAVCLLLSVCVGMSASAAEGDTLVYNDVAPKIAGVTFASANKTSTMLQKYTSDQGDVVYNPEYEYTYPVYSATYTGAVSVSNSSGYVGHMKTGHPRLMTEDFSVYVDKAKTDFTAKRLFDAIMKDAERFCVAEPFEFYMNIRDNINDFCGNIERNVVTLAMAYNLQKAKVERGDEDAVTDYVKYAERAVADLLNAATYPHWSQDAFLCTAEISVAYAFGYDWLYDYLSLPENAEKMQIIKNTIYEMSLVPYATNYANKKYWGTNNWNEVCNGSGILTAIAFYDAEDATGKFSGLCEYILESAAHYLHKGLIQYQDDGFFREGIGYWSYATEYLIRAIDAYQNALADNFVLPARFQHINVKGVKDTAEFPIYMNGVAGTLNFGDCASSYVYHEVLYWFASYLNKPEYTAYLNAFMQQIGRSFGAEDASFAMLWYASQEQDFGVLSNLSPDKAHVSEDDLNILTLRKAFDRNEAFVGMHGGNFDASHNAMSLGGFVLDMNGKRFVKTLGSGNYVWPGYFSCSSEDSQRYTYYCARAEGNNTLIFDPGYVGEQKKGSQAKIIQSGTSLNTGYGVLDLTQTNDKLAKHYRGIMLTDDRRRVIVQDEFEAKSGAFKDVYWFAHTGDPTTTSGAVVELAPDGKSAVLTIGTESIVAKITAGPENAKFEWVNAEPLPTSPNPEIQHARMAGYGKKLRIHLTDVSATTLRVEFSPVELANTELAIPAIAQWDSLLSNEVLELHDTYINQSNYETDWYKENYTTYYIHDDKDLAGLAYMVNNGTSFEGKTVKLVNDIEMDNNFMWVPIGTQQQPFKGTFDGSQKTINALNIQDATRNAGLFGALNGATIKNVLLKNATVSGMSDIGILAGTSVNSSVYNVFVLDCLVRGSTRLGGVVGTQTGGSILNSGVSGKVFGVGAYYGGIVGYATGIVDNCAANVQMCESTKTVYTTKVTKIYRNDDGQLMEMVTTSSYSVDNVTQQIIGTNGPTVVENVIETGEVGETTSTTSKVEGIAPGNNYCGVVGISAYGDVKNSYYRYTLPLVPSGMKAYSANSANIENSCGKFMTTTLNVSTIGSDTVESTLKYEKQKTLEKCLNAWIADSANPTDYITWEFLETTSIGMPTAVLHFVPETVIDENDKDLFEISNVSVVNGTVEFKVQSEKYGANTGYLVVVQKKADGTSDIKMLFLNMTSKSSEHLSVSAFDDASVQVFVLDSFMNMKIKSNVVKL